MEKGADVSPAVMSFQRPCPISISPICQSSSGIPRASGSCGNHPRSVLPPTREVILLTPPCPPPPRQKYTFPAETRLQDLTLARQVYTRTIQSSLRHGTTCALYFATQHLEPTKLLVELAIDLGQRAYVGKVNMDRHSPDNYVEETQVLRLTGIVITWIGYTITVL
jgi:hypothetical protein